MARDKYLSQMRLLMRALPLIAEEEVFALKGGTAINLFYRNMPRLSIDIDLNYLPLASRKESLTGIGAALRRIAKRIERQLRDVRITTSGRTEETHLEIRHGDAAIKIEISPVMRGTIHQPELRRVAPAVEEQFGFAELTVVAFEDLFAGKLVAALDRQHPRDLFDVKVLYEHEGITNALFRAFLVYVASSSRPPHELLQPNPISIDRTFVTDFEGMTFDPITYEELMQTRTRLFTEVGARLEPAAKQFLLSLHDGAPDFATIGLPNAANLPAIRWKILNLERLRNLDPEKHARQRTAIQALGHTRIA